MEKKTHSIHLRLAPEDAVVLNHLSKQVGTSPTNFARELVKAGLHGRTNELLVQSTSIDEIVAAVMDIRLGKLEERLAELLVMGMIYSLESKGIVLNMMRQFLNYQDLPRSEIDKTMTHIKKVVAETARERVKKRELD